MDLFNEFNPYHNLLPYDGEVLYHGAIFTTKEANRFLELLLKNVPWKNDEAIIYGKRIITARKVAWYGDDTFKYSYSNTTKQALPWTKELVELKQKVESVTGVQFNSCLLNLYHDGTEGMSWHSDDEKSLGRHTCIASLSLGAERKFSFKHKKTNETHSLLLHHGSLLIMQGATQENWRHSLPKSTLVKRPRINLTFRTFKEF